MCTSSGPEARSCPRRKSPSSCEIQNVTPEGEVYWQLNTDLGQAITFVQVVEDLYVRE